MKCKSNQKTIFAFFVILAAVLVLGSGCKSPSAENTEAPLKLTFVENFNDFNKVNWQKSDGWTNGSMFNCGWLASHVGFSGGIMTLTLDNTPSSGKKYSSGEYRTNNHYSYGKFEVRMKAAANPGIVSSFFTYTGPSEGKPHDEIDIEFLGKNTRKVQLNYFKADVGGHEKVIDLGFDASKEFHVYGFLWEPDKITWYVDGKIVNVATTDIPTVPGKIMMNLWPGIGVDDWLGAYDGTVPLHASYDWVRYSALR